MVDLSKKRKRESNLPDLVTRGGLDSVVVVSQPSDKYPPDDTADLTVTTEEKTNKMVKSHSATNSPTCGNQELVLDNAVVPTKTKPGHKKRKHKKKREEAEHGVSFKGNRPG